MKPFLISKTCLSFCILFGFGGTCHARNINVPDGTYNGYSQEQKTPVFAVIRSGRVLSARFGRVSGCDSSTSGWSCDRVETKKKKIGPCELRWTVPWEQGFAYQVDINNNSCKATVVVAKNYMCAPYGDDIKIPCQVWVDGNKVSVGGFQAAPIFKMQSSWKAINHRRDTIKVMKGPNYTMFLNTVTDSSLRIYGFEY